MSEEITNKFMGGRHWADDGSHRYHVPVFEASMMEDAEAEMLRDFLYDESDWVSPHAGTYGLHGGIYEGFRPIDIQALEDTVVTFTMAQKLLDNVNTTG